MRLACVVLAGGEGLRMGGDKPRRPFGGGTLLQAALGLAHSYAGDVAIAVREPSQADAPGTPLLTDDPSIPGPLAGLASALRWARAIGADAVLTLPCDTPGLPPDLAERLLAALSADPAARAALPESGGQLHPVCGLWRTAALDRLAAYCAAGRRSLKGFAGECGMVTVCWSAEPEDPFAGANTPQELAALQRRGG